MGNVVISDSIADQVYNILKGEIVAGMYPPGYQIVETEVASRLRVSRSPVRYAIHQLSREGLLDYFPNRGAFIKRYSTKEVHDSFEIRLLLESYAITHIDPEYFSEYRPQLEKIMETLQVSQHEANDDIDSQVHSLAVLMTGNSVLLNQFSVLYSMTSAFRSISLSNDEMIEMARQSHLALLESIAAGNTQRALRLIKKHLVASEQQVLRYYQEGDEGADG